MKIYFILFSLLFVACEKEQAPILDLKAKSFTLNTLEGQSYTPLANKRVTLLSFWAAWCKPCLMEISILNDLNEKYQNQNFQVIGMNVDENISQVPQVLKQYPMSYLNLMTTSAVQESFGGISALPTMILVKDGEIQAKMYGSKPKNIIEDAIKTALKK